MEFQHEDFGISVQVAELRQFHIEDFFKAKRKLDGDNEINLSVPELLGSIVRAACRAKIIESGVKESDVGDMIPKATRWLAEKLDAYIAEAMKIPPGMIVAAALAAEGKPPPPILDRLRKWRYFSTPWRAGGLYDQDAGELDRMIAAENIHDTWYAYKTRPKGWNKLLEGKWDLLRYIAWLILTHKPPGYEDPPRGVRKLATEYLKRILKNADKKK